MDVLTTTTGLTDALDTVTSENECAEGGHAKRSALSDRIELNGGPKKTKKRNSSTKKGTKKERETVVGLIRLFSVVRSFSERTNCQSGPLSDHHRVRIGPLCPNGGGSITTKPLPSSAPPRVDAGCFGNQRGSRDRRAGGIHRNVVCRARQLCGLTMDAPLRIDARRFRLFISTRKNSDRKRERLVRRDALGCRSRL